MSSNNLNGIFGYEKSKQKKIKDNLYGYNGYAGNSAEEPMSEQQRATLYTDAARAGEQIARERATLDAPFDKNAKMAQYRKSATNFLVPSANDELRRRRLFAMSDRTINDAADALYEDGVKDVFQNERSEAEELARNEYKKYVSVPSPNPESALGAMRRAADPESVIGKTMHKIDGAKLDEVANKYAGYARMSPEAYRKELLEPAVRQRLHNEYVNDAKPKSSAEYMARNAYNSSITGKLMDINLNAHSQTNSQSLIEREGLEAYDANRLEKLASGIGSLVVDMPLFSGIGALSSSLVKGTAGIAKGLSSSIAKKYASKGIQSSAAERMVEQAIKSKMAAKIAGSSATQALTLGGYDVGNSISDDLLLNDGIDVEKAVKAYGHGLATGAAVGVVGTPLKTMSRGLTGGKKIAASTGVLGAESAVFTASSEMQKAAAGVDVEPIDLLYDFGESVATLGAMRLAHWRPTGGYAKLTSNGKLKEQFSFTDAEQRDMLSSGINPRIFINELESVLNVNSRESVANRDNVKNMYLQMMNGDKLSAATRLKLLYLVENKITSTPPYPTDYNVEVLENGNYKFSYLDANGRRIESKDNMSYNQVQNVLLKSKDILRRNKIAHYENEILGASDSDNFFRQAGEYAREKNIPLDNVVDVLFNKSNEKELSPEENKMLEEISQRASYGDVRVGYMLQNMRRGLEKKYNLSEGSLLDAINKRSYMLAHEENLALDEYLDCMRNEAELLKSGVSNERIASLDKGMQASSYGDFTNYEAKINERRRFMQNNMGKNPNYNVESIGETMTYPIEVPKQWNGSGTWSYYGHRNSPTDIIRYENRARELAEKLGYAIRFVYDERSIPLNEFNVEEYNNKVRAMGWLDNNDGKVYINLPNIRNMHELEKTVVHEMIGHGGMSNLFGEYLYEFYDNLYRRSDPALRKEFHKLAQRYGLSGYAAIEEYLAELTEKNAPTPKEAAILNGYKNFIGNMLVEKKYYSPDNKNVTTEDLRDFLTAHHEAMLAKKRPNEYRNSVLNRFPEMKEIHDYYNHDNYERFMQEKYPDKQKALEETPDFIWDDKRRLFDFLNYNGNSNKPTSYRFIGERGAQRLANSEYRNQLLEPTPEKALQMEREGASPEDIWKATGWERGGDGKWRSEINEDNLDIRDLTHTVLKVKSPEAAAAYDVINKIPESQRTVKQKRFLNNIYKKSDRIFKGVDLRLHHLIGDPVFFTAYPELVNIPVVVTNKLNVPSKYDVIKNKLYVNSKNLTNPEELKVDIVGSLQYMIQENDNLSRSVELMRADLEGKFARNYNKALSLSRKLNRLNTPHSRQLYDIASKLFKQTYKVHPNDFETYYPSSNEYILKIIYNEPRSLSADVEARNAHIRQYLSDEERREALPAETEDVPREMQVPFIDMKQVESMLDGPLDVIDKSFKNIGSDLLGEFKRTDRDRVADQLMYPYLNAGEQLKELRKKKLREQYLNKMRKTSSNLDNAKLKPADFSDFFYYDKYGNIIPYEKDLWIDENDIKRDYKPFRESLKNAELDYYNSHYGGNDKSSKPKFFLNSDGKPMLLFRTDEWRNIPLNKEGSEQFFKDFYDIDPDDINDIDN